MPAAGFRLWSLRGIVLRVVCDDGEARWLMFKSVPLGSRHLSSLLVCSLVERCHGECGSQKKTSMPNAVSMAGQCAISQHR